MVATIQYEYIDNNKKHRKVESNAFPFVPFGILLISAVGESQ